MNVAQKRAQDRNYLINQLADKFEASGIEYTCGRVVIEFVELHITDDQLEVIGMSQRRLANRVWGEVQARWKIKEARPV